jgi:hypothetical protein
MKLQSLIRLASAAAGVAFGFGGQIGGTPVALSAPERAVRFFKANHLVVSRSVYQGTPTTVTVGELPPNCPITAKCGGANNKGAGRRSSDAANDRQLLH